MLFLPFSLSFITSINQTLLFSVHRSPQSRTQVPMCSITPALPPLLKRNYLLHHHHNLLPWLVSECSAAWGFRHSLASLRLFVISHLSVRWPRGKQNSPLSGWSTESTGSHVLLGDQASALVLPVLVGHLTEGLRAQESGVAVLGHQHIDPVLGRVEAQGWGRCHVGFGDVPCLMVDIDLQMERRRERGEDRQVSLYRVFLLSFSVYAAIWKVWWVELMKSWIDEMTWRVHSLLAVRRCRWIRRRSSGLWLPAWRWTWCSCTPRRRSRTQCSPRWTQTQGKLWRHTGHLQMRCREEEEEGGGKRRTKC